MRCVHPALASRLLAVFPDSFDGALLMKLSRPFLVVLALFCAFVLMFAPTVWASPEQRREERSNMKYALERPPISGPRSSDPGRVALRRWHTRWRLQRGRSPFSVQRLPA